MADTSLTEAIILTLLSGSVGGTIVAWRTKVTEFRREDHARWVTERRDAYVTFLRHSSNAAYGIELIALQLRGGPMPDLGTLDAQKTASEVLASIKALQESVELLRLLAPAPAVAAVRELNGAVVEHLPAVLHVAEGGTSEPVLTKLRAHEAFDPLLDAVIEQARRDLGSKRTTPTDALRRRR